MLVPAPFELVLLLVWLLVFVQLAVVVVGLC
jgi:hypothetical protein